MASKVCASCLREKPVSAFGIDRRRKDGLNPYCTPCRTLRAKATTKQDSAAPLNGRECPLCHRPVRGHPNRVFCSDYCKNRCASLAKKFNLTPDDFRAIVDDSEGKCPICLCNMRKQPVDHNHKTMEVTGVVCTRCNIGLLAYSNHDPEVARRLYEYLSNPPAFRVLGRKVLANPQYFRDEKSQIHRTWARRGKKAA